MIPNTRAHAARNAATAGPGVTHPGAPSGFSGHMIRFVRRGITAIAVLLATLVSVVPAVAEEIQPRDLPRTLLEDVKSLVMRRENYVIGAIGAGATWAGTALDDRIVESDFNSEFDEETALDHAFEPGYYLGGGAVQIGGAFATYGLGLMWDKPEAQALGADLVRAQLISGAITVGLKKAVGRQRPDESSNTSFPSGHASGSFATATVLHRRYGTRAGLLAYLLATYVSASRLNESQHFLSDVLAGAALGIVVGRTVTRDHDPGGLGVYPMVSPGGFGFRFVFRPVARAPSSGTVPAADATANREIHPASNPDLSHRDPP